MNDAVEAAESPESRPLRRQLRDLLANDGDGATDDIFRLGHALHLGGDAEAALAAFESLLPRAPQLVPLWHAVATLRFQLGRPKAALEACNAALRLAPEDADSLFNAAVVLQSMGDIPAAAHCYARALQFDGRHPGALLNYVSLLLSEKRVAEALVVSEAAIAQRPDDADCWFNRGEAMTSASRHEDALLAYERALQLMPSMAKAEIAAAVAEAALGRLECAGRRLSAIAERNPPAVSSFRSPLETDRASAYPELEPGRIALIAAYQRHRICDWQHRDVFVRLFEQVVDGVGCKPMDNPDLPFFGLGLPLAGECRLRAARQVAARLQSEVQKMPLARAPRRRDGRLRIGYLSGDFRRHATAYLMSRLPALHDRQRFEVFLYSCGPDDGSEIRQEIIAGADAFCDVAHFTAAATAQRIAMDGVDILVDLSGYTLHSRPAVMALRPAPVQVSYLAYLQSLGAPWIDYAMLDHHVLTAEERPYWSESIVRLPHTLYLCDDRAVALPDAGTRADAGLPEAGVVFACLNAPWKIDPDVFGCWMQILQRLPTAVLWLYDDLGQAGANLRAAALAAGVAPERLIFAPVLGHEAHLARFGLADVFLDTFSCNAHTTCIEAIAAGVPVLTLPGTTVVARVAASLLRAQGVPELVVDSREAYVESACRLAHDAAWRDRIRQRLGRMPQSALFCTERRVREIERAYELMWGRHTAGLPPADIDVPA